MNTTNSEKPSNFSIAPRSYIGSNGERLWYASDWKNLDLSNKENLNLAIQIFSDRMNFRFLDPIKCLIHADNKLFNETKQRYYGFSIMALICLIIETLAQFYSGKNESPKKNRIFYKDFLRNESFVLKTAFTNDEMAYFFYDSIRCGILHQAETKLDSIIRLRKNDASNCAIELSESAKSVIVYRDAFQKMIFDEFNEYIVNLENPDKNELRDNFNKKMKFICRIS